MNKLIKHQKDWFRDRGYLHITNRTTERNRKYLERYIKNPVAIASHRFSPLILKQTNTRRYKYSLALNKRSHKSLDDKGSLTSNAKVRPIMYATHIDSNIYSYYSQRIIQPKYEDYLKENSKLNDCVTAYRQIKSDDKVRFKYNVDFAKEVFEEIKQRGTCAVLAFDIENFFPTLNHPQLKKIWSKILGTKTLPKDHYALYKSITNYSYFYYDDLRKRNKGHLDEKKIAQLRNQGKFQFFNNYSEFQESGIQVYKNQTTGKNKISGIPQGLPISALLANLYMLPFDESIIDNLVKSKGCYYRRYSDDLVVVCNTNDVNDIEKFILSEIKKIALTISPSKTEKFQFGYVNNKLSCFKIENNKLTPNSSLQYLGFDFYGYKTLIKAGNLSQFYREMKESISMKSKRIEAVQKKYLTNESIVYKRKVYRLYSFRGIQSRKLPASKAILQDGKLINKQFSRKYRGNFIKYAYRASDIMDAPEIRRQVRRHMRVLKNYLSQFDFDN